MSNLQLENLCLWQVNLSLTNALKMSKAILRMKQVSLAQTYLTTHQLNILIDAILAAKESEQKLEYLNLSGNNFEGVDETTLSSSCLCLETILLRYCRLKSSHLDSLFNMALQDRRRRLIYCDITGNTLVKQNMEPFKLALEYVNFIKDDVTYNLVQIYDI